MFLAGVDTDVLLLVPVVDLTVLVLFLVGVSVEVLLLVPVVNLTVFVLFLVGVAVEVVLLVPAVDLTLLEVVFLVELVLVEAALVPVFLEATNSCLFETLLFL